MSIVIAYLCESGVIFGSDSRIVRGDNYRDGGEKYFKIDNFVFGVAGGLRETNIIKHSLKLPRKDPVQDIDKYIHTVIPAEIRKTLKTNGALCTEDGIERNEGKYILWCAENNSLYIISQNFCVDKVSAKGIAPYAVRFAAIGSGAAHAEGAIFIMITYTPKENTTENEIVFCGIEAANNHITSCGGKIHTDFFPCLKIDGD
jgi:hypothetical protein